MGDEMPQLSAALENIWGARKGGWASLQKCVLRSVVDDHGDLVDAAGGPTLCADKTVDTMFDLSFLDPVRCADRDFLPQQLFVRWEVQDMVTRLATQCQNPREKSRVLTGSPGIGKSVVFFLAAVKRAATLDQPLIYLRKTKEEGSFISVFIMKKRANAGGSVDVDIVFGRELPVDRNPDLSELNNAIRDASGLPDKDFYVMLDGPKHNDEKTDLLYNAYHCLCTSGGYPAVSQEEIGVKMIYVLSGWTEDKIMEAMGEMSVQDPQNKYNLCGGRVRLALMADGDIKTWFDRVVGSIGPGAIKLAVMSNAATGCLESSDRLRTRFFRYDGGREVSEMIVDSRYAFNLLKGRLARKDIRDAYNLAKALELKAAQGWFYEETLHRCFQELKTQPGSPIQDWKQEEGSGAEGVASFVTECADGKTGIYWAPGIPNFPNIDAAILLEPSTLTCFQYTVQASHAFDRQSFRVDFVNRFVLDKVRIECVRVVFATPSDVEFDMGRHQEYEEDFSSSEGTHTRTSPLSRISVSFSHVSVDASSTPDDVAAKLLSPPNEAG